MGVFTSVNAVDVVFDEYSVFFLKENAGVRFAAIGPKTAEALRKYSIEPDFVPDEYVAEAILPGLGDVKASGSCSHALRSPERNCLKRLPNAGGIVHEIIVYQTLPAEIDMDGLSALKSGVDIVTFTSASTVENFIAISKQNGLDPLNLPNNPLFACIGPITEQAAKEAGFQNLVVAKEYTTDGLIEAITNMEKL
jgi:uroporphyrinogen III methyltransferase / synthase